MSNVRQIRFAATRILDDEGLVYRNYGLDSAHDSAQGEKYYRERDSSEVADKTIVKKVYRHSKQVKTCRMRSDKNQVGITDGTWPHTYGCSSESFWPLWYVRVVSFTPSLMFGHMRLVEYYIDLGNVLVSEQQARAPCALA